MLYPGDETHAEVVREALADVSLKNFAVYFWHCYEPSQPFIDNWHIGAMCEFLTAWRNREFQNGVINIPPGTGKSAFVDTFFDAWVWATDPGHKFLHCAFDMDLCLRDADRIQAILADDDYQIAFGQVLRRDMSAKRNLWTKAGGYRFSTTPRGKGTGRHFRSVSINDPVKPADVLDGNIEQGVKDAQNWVDNTLPTRRSDPEAFGVLMTMQRLIEQDPAGVALNTGKYEHLCLPMRYEPQAHWIIGDWSDRLDPRTEPGELLHESRYPATAVADLEESLAEHASAQLQQNPIPRTGGLVEESHLRWEWVEVPKTGGYWIQVWDFAAKGTASTHSAVHGALWCAAECNQVNELMNLLADRDRGAQPVKETRCVEKALRYHLIDEVWGVWDVPTSEQQFIAAQTRPHWSRSAARIIEEKAAGVGLIQTFRRKGYQHIVAFHEINDECKELARLDKLDRHRANVGEYHAGRVLLPPWYRADKDATARAEGAGPDAFRREMLAFPRGARDDRVDTSSMALARLTQHRETYWANVRNLAQRANRRRKLR